MTDNAPFRARFSRSKLIVVKVGTSVITRPDGMLALGRVGSLVEQISQLVKQEGKQVVLVASGAIGIGTGKLNEQAMLSRSIRTHMHSAGSPSAMALPSSRAAAGQGGLMGLYDRMFSEFGLMCGQVLVTETDFEDQTRRARMATTLKSMLQMGVVPVINENDVLAIPSRRKLFTDNDSLSVLVALELRAEVLLLFSDVEGIYREAPRPGMRPLQVLSRATKVDFGAKSARGRGGMEAKVAAALDAVDRGVGAVVVASGLAPNSLLRVVSGEAIGTVVLREAEARQAEASLTPPPAAAGAAGASARAAEGALRQARAARAAARQLQQLSYEERQAVLHGMAAALEAAQAAIRAANQKDTAEAARVGMSGAMAARLELPAKKLKVVCDGMRAIAAQPDPLGKTLRHVQIAEGLELVKESVPIGVLLVIFESRPDVLPQVAALAVASGNGLLLKGGKEAAHTNAVLHATLCAAIERASGGRVPGALVGLVEGREAIAPLLQLHEEIDLVIPRGSNSMVQSIMRSTKIPTLGHADGVCHMFVDAKADLAKATRLMIDAKTDYPAACNALETLLLHEALVGSGGAQQLLAAARAAKISLFGGPHAAARLGLPPAEKLRHEYGELAMCVEVVPGLDAAVEHINTYGSGHTDVVVSEDPQVAAGFMRRVDAANVFHNASSRFADGYRFGLGAEVGISTGRIHARGPVGVEGLLTTRNRLVSTSEHTVADFASGKARYTHRDLMARL